MRKNIIIRSVLIVAVALPYQIAVHAQPVKLASTDTVDFYISPQQDAVRLGSGVMLKVYAINKSNKYGYSHRILAHCEGKWLSTTFQDTFLFDVSTSPTGYFSKLTAEEVKYERTPIELTTFGATKLKYADSLIKRLTNICKSADREPKNFQVPISSSIEDANTTKTQELVTGTSARIGKEIDVWIRTIGYKKSEMKDVEGKVISYDGKTQYIYERISGYEMRRSAFDCGQRKMGTFEVSTYTEGKATPSSDSVDRDKLRLTFAVPDSIGEAQLDWICAIYANNSP
jgi:hypothetical protein